MEIRRTEGFHVSASPPIPEELRRLMAELGPIWAQNVPGHVRRMVEAFTPLLARCPRDGVEVRRDVPYGAHPRQVLDVYRPADAVRAPLVVFVHGGAFVDGEKDRSAEIYGNVCTFFARHGVIGINIEYRLAPEFRFPAGTEDVAGAVRWAVAHAAEIGADPARVLVFGHSAGAAHAAHYAYSESARAGSAAPAGLIVVSGRVRADNLPENPNAKKVETYYGTDASVYEARSAVSLLRADSVPTFIAIAEFENPLLDVYCLELAYAIARLKRRAPRLLQLPGHNHTSIIAHLNTAEDTLGRAILAFIADPR